MEYTKPDLEKKTISELKSILKGIELSTQGKKEDLVNRILQFNPNYILTDPNYQTLTHLLDNFGQKYIVNKLIEKQYEEADELIYQVQDFLEYYNIEIYFDNDKLLIINDVRIIPDNAVIDMLKYLIRNEYFTFKELNEIFITFKLPYSLSKEKHHFVVSKTTILTKFKM
jgi:hypothetical protein